MTRMKKFLILALTAALMPAISVAKKDKTIRKAESRATVAVEKAQMPETTDSLAIPQPSPLSREVTEDDQTTPGTESEEENYLSEIERLKKERDFFKTYYMKEIRKNLSSDRQYLGGSFAELNSDRISEIVDRYNPCSDEKEFADIIGLATASLSNQNAYESARNLMAEDGPDFTPELPAQVTLELSKIQGDLSETQRSELEALKEMAEVYPRAIKTFQERIRSIRDEKLLRDRSTTDKQWAISIQTDDIPVYLASNAIKNEYRYRISRVPKLKALYDEWIRLLTKNFLDPKTIAIEDSILNITPAEEEASGENADGGNEKDNDDANDNIKQRQEP